MTDSMKFGPEWLRNMSAEPPSVGGSSTNNNMSAMGAGGGSALSLHSLGGGGVVVGGGGAGGNILASHSHTSASRNMFPEYRYGREEMLSLFDRNCLLPQILPSFKKLFVDKVQFPLALTPSSEEEMNSQSQLGNTRPAWLQRPAGGFGIPSRGTGRGGTVERGRMRGKSVYHPIYQRPGAVYDDSLSAISTKPERNWSERNGTGDSAVVSGPPGGNGGVGLDWNGTPNSSPRKEFSSHNRNMENWRRNRNEDGSGDAPSTGSVAGTDVAGWRSGATHRWGRSTSWRDEEPIQSGNIDVNSFGGNTTTNIQRSISAIGTVGTDRSSASPKTSVSGIGAPPGSGGTRQMSLKWSGNAGGPDGDDNLPEWAMENPSEIGGTFDSSGAFHGEGADPEFQAQRKTEATPRRQAVGLNTLESKDADKSNAAATTNANTKNGSGPEQGHPHATDSKAKASAGLEEDMKLSSCSTTEAAVTNNNNNNKLSAQEMEAAAVAVESTPTHKLAVHGDISDRFKEVADEVEKLIMDDDGDNRVEGIVNDVAAAKCIGVSSRYGMPGLSNSVLDAVQLQHQHHLKQHPMIGQHPETAATAMLGELSHKPLPFSEQLVMHHLQQQQQQPQHLPVLPPHMINANPNELWFYRDPQTNVQGPFSAMEMTEWYRAGYFNENLFVRRFSDSRFRPLGELIKLCHGNVPFTHSHLLPTPMDLDNLQIGLAPRKPSTLMGEQQQHRSNVAVDEQLKANVTAAADALSAAVKGHMSAHNMDTSIMLTMRFQMLQDQYMQHQEYQILSELSKNECFQRLDAQQREAIVRSKVQMLVLPEYLSSFNGLSNSLAALNPIAGSQLYDAIAQQAKKDQQQQIFPSGADQRPGAGNFLDANDFIINAQLMHQQTQAQAQGQGQGQAQQTNHLEQMQPFGSNPEASKLNELPSPDLDLLNEYNLRMLLRRPSAAASQQQQQQQASSLVKPNPGVDFMTESQLLAAQNIILPMWPQNLQQPPTQQWPSLANEKVTLWDVATLEEEQNQLMLQQQQQQLQNRHLSAPESALDFDVVPQQGHQRKEEEEPSSNLAQAQQTQQASIVDVVMQHRKDQQANQQQQAAAGVKQVNRQQPPAHKQPIGNAGRQPELKISEEERRREQVEEKRRLKEERKRQQQEEEKRRALLAEEEKNRQQQEEKDRQQQIQAQRRKALLGIPQTTATATGAATANASSSASAASAIGAINKGSAGVKVDQQTGRSIAPWSLQTASVNSAAPGLAEIQKAERRERRADQQRQQEQMDKQIRASAAAAAEANDALLKWQAAPAPAPVMSLVDIQAEEAKRLANDMLEHQRRREHEQQQQATLVASLNVSGGLSNIWGNANKAWSGSAGGVGTAVAAGAGLWDEPTPAAAPAPAPAPAKYMSLAAATTPTAASVLAAGLPATSKQQAQVQAKSSAILPSPRNLRKSQTLPAMQNVLPRNGKTASASDKTKAPQSKATPKSAAGSEDKKSSLVNKSQQQQQSNNNDGASNKVSEYENEFTMWCMKSLDNMSAKVDVPTFVSFLQDLEAPYEVKDYVRIYLGEGKESTDFAKQFLERRSKYKSLQRAQNAHNDDMCKPAPAITPSANDNGDNKNKQKKVKKNKMTKMDARILGFSVTAAEGRINVGGRDYVDAP